MEKWAKNHATWRMGYSKMSGKDLPLEVHTLKIRSTKESTQVSLKTPAKFLYYFKNSMCEIHETRHFIYRR